MEHDRVRALVDVRPYAADDRTYYICADLTPGLDGLVAPTRPDLVLGVSAASTSLAQLTPRTQVASAMDLGTGCGVQSLHLAQHADRVVATDVNPRAMELAEVTLLLNRTEGVELRQGDLFAPVAEDTFDLITTNPPYVMSPPSAGPRLTYREGNLTGDGLVERIVRQGPDRLRPGGTLSVLGNWAHLRGARLAGASGRVDPGRLRRPRGAARGAGSVRVRRDLARRRRPGRHPGLSPAVRGMAGLLPGVADRGGGTGLDRGPAQRDARSVDPDRALAVRDRAADRPGAGPRAGRGATVARAERRGSCWPRAGRSPAMS